MCSSNSKSLEFLGSSRSEVQIPVLTKIFHRLLLSCFRINNYFMWYGKIVSGYDTDAIILNNATLFSLLFATFSLGHFPFGILTFGLFPWHQFILKSNWPLITAVLDFKSKLRVKAKLASILGLRWHSLQIFLWRLNYWPCKT